MRLLLLCALTLAGCFSPSAQAVDCHDGTFCPAGARCLGSGQCSASAVGGNDLGVPDLMPPGCPANTCGKSCTMCTPPTNAKVRCNGQDCAFECNDGYCGVADHCVSQKTDGANCGACGHVCPSGVCVGGRCTPQKVGSSAFPAGIALSVGGAALYWADAQPSPSGALWSIDTGAMPQQQNVAMNLGSPWALAVDATTIYFTQHEQPPTGNVYRVTPGNATPPLALTITNNVLPYGIALDADTVYWTNEGSGEVWRIAKTAGASPTLVANSQIKPHGIAVDTVNARVYWTATGEGKVYSAPTGMPKPPTAEATNLASPEGLLLAGGMLFCTTDGAITLVRHGGSSREVVTGLHQPFAMAADSTWLYFTERGTPPNFTDGRVARAELQDLTHVEVLASGLPNPWGIAVDATSVYWSTAVAGGGIYRLPK